MKLNFIKANPTENMTIFVTNTLPRNLYKDIANKLMAYDNIHAEQVGFIEKPSSENKEACIRLHMMGGEFCANALRALASILVFNQHPNIIKEDKGFIVPIEVSGVKDVVYCVVEATEEGHKYISTAKLPIHRSIKEIPILFNGVEHRGTLVEFPGITHLIISGVKDSYKKDFFKEAKEKLKHLEWEALGIMFYEEENLYMEPLVYVKATESLFWERGCGSGTAALGLALTYKDQRAMHRKISQPGGELEVITDWYKDSVTEVYLKGAVEIVAEGIVYI